MCFSYSEYEKHITNLAGHFCSNGYPFSIIKRGIKKASALRRDNLLLEKPKVGNSRIPLVMDYSSRADKLLKVLRQDFDILKSDTSIQDLFKDPPLMSRRQPPNLKSLLTSSRLPSVPGTGNQKCGKPRCQVCNFLITDPCFTPPGTKCRIRPGHFNCDTPNVVYLICCNICENGNYVGQTGSKFRLRFNNHKKTVKDKAISYPVAKHFSEHNHNLSNLKCILLGSNYRTLNNRLRSESKWILKLNTHINGLNLDLGALSDFPFVIRSEA